MTKEKFGGQEVYCRTERRMIEGAELLLARSLISLLAWLLIPRARRFD